MPCPAAGPVPMAMAAPGPMKMAGHHGAPHKHDDDQNHNCPFAPQAAALDFARLPDAILPPRPEPQLAQGFPRAVGIGSDLAAPPPPQTGPPFLA